MLCAQLLCMWNDQRIEGLARFILLNAFTQCANLDINFCLRAGFSDRLVATAASCIVSSSAVAAPAIRSCQTVCPNVEGLPSLWTRGASLGSGFRAARSLSLPV